jgi:hypothetical protein
MAPPPPPKISGGVGGRLNSLCIHKPNSPWPGIIKLFPARENLVVTSRLGTEKLLIFFLQCTVYLSDDCHQRALFHLETDVVKCGKGRLFLQIYRKRYSKSKCSFFCHKQSNQSLGRPCFFPRSNQFGDSDLEIELNFFTEINISRSN